MNYQVGASSLFLTLVSASAIATGSATSHACSSDYQHASHDEVARLVDEPAENGVYVSGEITLETEGKHGLAGVKTLLAVDAYPEDDAPYVITDRKGAYHFDFLPMEPGQTVYVRPVLEGYVLLPEWRWYDYAGSGTHNAELDFVAQWIGGGPVFRIQLPIAYRSQ